MHYNLQLEMEKIRVAPFFIPTAKYVVCVHRIHTVHILHNTKSIFSLFIPKSFKNLIKLMDVSH